MSKGIDFRSAQSAPRARLDLNLLEPLGVFLEERSVSMAAVRLRVSQPTASNLLAKLRRHFNDPLLVRQGNAYTLSSLALHLKGDLPGALQAVERITTAQMAFDPLSSSREFHILGTDYATARVGAPLLRLLATSVPSIRIRFRPCTCGSCRRGTGFTSGCRRNVSPAWLSRPATPSECLD